MLLSNEFVKSSRPVSSGDNDIVAVFRLIVRISHAKRGASRFSRLSASSPATWKDTLARWRQPSHKATPLMAAPVKA